MKKLVFIFLFQTYVKGYTQELFVFTEPASNMPANTIGIRVNNALMKDDHTNLNNYYLSPELMVGISKKIMVHAQVFMSNYSGSFKTNGASGYLKYRFYSNDEVHKHSRLAAFGRYSFNNTSVHQLAIDLMNKSSGYEFGVIATKLIHKTALSASVSFVHATDTKHQKFLFGNENRNAINYTFSTGKLLLPKEYESYKQVNVNIMAELLGQANTYSGDFFLDIAPSIQFIINSRLRIDAGYRFALVKKIYRSTIQSPLFRVEYNFYNVVKR